MMETILNLGLTDASVEGLAKKTGNRRFALDAYRRFIMMYGSTAMASAGRNSTRPLTR
jgi:pyruvate,orthophosphate dikinase